MYRSLQTLQPKIDSCKCGDSTCLMLAVSIKLRLQTSCSCDLSDGQALLHFKQIAAVIEQHDKAKWQATTLRCRMWDLAQLGTDNNFKRYILRSRAARP